MSQLIGELAYAIGDFRRDGHAHIFTAYNAVRQGAKNKPTPNPPITDVHPMLVVRLPAAPPVADNSLLAAQRTPPWDLL